MNREFLGVGCLVILIVCVWLVGKVYETQLANAASQVTTLQVRLNAVTGDRDDLRAKLAEGCR